MRKNEKIEQLERQVQELLQQIEYSSPECSYPEPYFPKLSKTEAFDMVIRALHTQPNSTGTLESLMVASDAILEWVNKDNSTPSVDNDLKVWSEVILKFAWKITSADDSELPNITEQLFNELNDQYLIVRK